MNLKPTPSRMFKARVRVTLRPSILDPKGKAAEHALHQLGMDSIAHVRIGKYMELDVDESSMEDAREKVEQACRKLLANEVMEDFEVEIHEAEDRAPAIGKDETGGH